MSPRAEAGALAASVGLLLLLVGYGWQTLRIKRTKSWPKTWATIESSEMDIAELDSKTDIVVPCFTFSYVAAGANYSGRFSLFTNGEEEGELVAKKMTKRSFELQYDPKHPSTWYIPDKKMDGYAIEQKMTPRFLDEPSPLDQGGSTS